MNLICTLRSLSAFAVITLAACGGGDDNGSTTPAATSGTGTIGASGGTVASANGVATAVFPANAFATDTAVTIAASSSAPASAQLVSGTAFDFGPSGTLAQPAQMTLKYTPPSLPGGALESRLVMSRGNAAGRSNSS